MHENRGSDRFRRVIERIDRLPSLPQVLVKLSAVVNSPDTSADDAAELIEKDPGLTSTVLRLANSAFYGMPRTISSVSSAVVVLGFSTLRSVALSAAVMKLFPGRRGEVLFSRERFWRHSVVSATIARSIARQQLNSMMIDPESVFCASILHDVGKLIFDQYVGDEFAMACSVARKERMPLYEAESRVLGITHAHIGNILADKWALPLNLEQAIVYHHRPADADRGQEITGIVHLADCLAHEAGISLWEEEQAPSRWSGVEQLPGMDELKPDALQRLTGDSIERAEEFLSITRGA
jgi:putative nucleotidyltransferase with HDIG domain